MKMDVKYAPLGAQKQPNIHKQCKDSAAGKRRYILPVSIGLLLTVSAFVLYTLHTCPHYQLAVIDIELPSIDIHKTDRSTQTTLIDQLRKVIFLNSGRTSKDDNYVWRSINCGYLESQNVSGPYKGWADQGECNYLHWENDGKYVSPPNGIRSSVPLGGISTGVFELRGDGTFHEWTIFNQHPAGSAKIQIMDDMFMAVRAEPNTTEPAVARVLQTKPTNGLPGVRSMDYRGSYPVSHIIPEDPSLPIDVSLYAYHWYKHGDMNTSATPAVAFTAILTNPSSTTEYKASFMINLPLGIEPHTQRSDPQMPKFVPILKGTPENATYEDVKHFLPTGQTTVFQLERKSEPEMATDCFNLCTEDCQSWTFNVSIAKCFIYNDVRMNGHNDGFYSGVKTNWSADSECLMVNRDTPGFNTNGNMSLCAYSSDSELKLSAGAGDSVTAMWEEFSSKGTFSDKPAGPHVQGMLSGQVTLKPMESKEVTIVLGWYFPERDFLGIPVGNFYTHFVDDSSDAARSLGKNLQNAVSDASKLHSPFFGSSVKETLQDMLINSLSHIRSAFWLKDGRWRQWEAHDCVNIDSVHNDGERHIPYIMIFPNSTINKLRAWAGFQLENGMIQEQLRCGCQSLPIQPVTVEFGCGRVMSDVSSMFIVYLLELLQWHPDPSSNEVVKELWPYAKRAAQWHLDIAKDAGLPQHLVTTYDILAMAAYPFASYNGAFHLLAMKACQRLATAMNDTSFAAECEEAYHVGQEAMDTLLWNSTENYYNAYTLKGGEFDKDSFFEDLNMNLCGYEEYHREEWGECYDSVPTTPGAIMTDTFYAQVLAYSLGLGTLVKDEQKLRDHMKAERAKSDTDKGMLVVTGRYTTEPFPFQDHAIWMMGDANWASITIHLGEDVQVAMNELLETFDYWRTGLNEIWNVAGILSSGHYTEESVPYITSHYGYYMSSWHIIIALSGQNVDVNAQTMTFSPKLPAPYKLPVMIPTVWGSLESQVSHKSTILTYTVKLEFGKVELKELSVDGCKYPVSGTVVLSADSSPVEWHC